MKVLIDIPKEFERDLQDKFNEFFERVKCDINSLLKSQEISMCGNYERETAEMFLSAFKEMKVLDEKTNGEVFDAMVNVDEDCEEVVGKDGCMTFVTTQDWRNAKYRGKNDNS